MRNSLSQAANNRVSFPDMEESSSSSDDRDAVAQETQKKKLEAKGKDGGAVKTIWKTVLLAFLTAMAGFSYVWGMVCSDQTIQKLYDHNAENIFQWAQKSVSDIQDDLASLSIHITSVGVTEMVDWPFFVLNNFELVVQEIVNASNVEMIGIAPIVSLQSRSDWELFSIKQQGWVEQGFYVHSEDDVDGNGENHDVGVSSEIFRIEGFGRVTEYGPGPYLPLWQFSSANQYPSHLNFNLLSIPMFSEMFHLVDATRQPVLSGAIDDTNPLGDVAISQKSGRRSFLLQPIFDSFSDQPEVVGVVVAVVPWDAIFTNNLHELDEGGHGLFCVFRDSCGQSFTYEIDGNEAIYIGEGDHHDSLYDQMEKVVDFGPTFHFDETVQDPDRESMNKCIFNLHLYPSRQFYNDNNEKRAGLLAILLVIYFILACFGVILYDCVAQWTERKVKKSTEQTQALLSSLFPGDVRDQLLHKPGDSLRDNDRYGVGQAAAKRNIEDMIVPSTHHIDYHADGHNTTAVHFDQADDDEAFDGKPIAHFFPNTTVMFADIAGFTAWSSEREPEQVFRLLETIYSEFDSIAHRRGVFKVETIGDCYIAVTGLPDPQPHHALIMCRFARDCRVRMNYLVRALENLLGPETADLSMRFGIHSGPVTAGVLRGQRARFQLYGDTVNLASRIESTSQRNRIHISQETADLLIDAGKSNWVVPREEQLIPLRDTFWLTPRQRAGSASSGTDSRIVPSNLSSNGSEYNVNVDYEENFTKPPNAAALEGQRLRQARRIDRLVEWNVEVLAKELKRIVANRKAIGKASTSKSTMAQIEKDILGESYVVNEVKDYIKFPKFSERVVRARVDPETIELKPAVESQLREFVRVISQYYRDNPFHNFEHASHVVMSMGKLLSRIVMYDTENDVEDEKSLHDSTYGITSDPLAHFAVLLCGMIHDVDHKGVPNFQLINERHKLARKYRNRSVLEQNSVDVAWELLMQDKFRDLRRCIYSDENEFQRFRQFVVNTVIATDIFDEELNKNRKKKWEKAFSRSNKDKIEMTIHETAHLRGTIVLEYLVQASDVAHTMQHWRIFEKWNEKLFEEMSFAYHSGKIATNPADGWYEGEISFFENCIIPLAKKLSECGVFGVSSDEYLQFALANLDEWKKKGKEHVELMAAKYSDNYWKFKVDEGSNTDSTTSNSATNNSNRK